MKASNTKTSNVNGLSTPSVAERALAYGLLGISAVLFLLPAYWLVVSAFKTQSRIFSHPPEFIPLPPVLVNLSDVFEQTPLLRAFINTSLIAAIQVSLTLLLCSLAGLAFARYRHAPGHKFLFGFVLATMMIPGAVTTIPVFIVLAKLHMINTYWAMILPGAANAFGIFWMRQYIGQNVPEELYDAAEIDGAGPFATYWQIVIPIIKPALGALGVLVLISSWNNLMWAFITLRTENMQTMPLLVYLMQGDQRTPYGLIMAAGLIATVPLVIAFLIFQRSFISGVTAGAVKG